MKYCDAIEYVEVLPVYEETAKQGDSLRLLQRLGEPQKELTFVYIEGTQGRETIPAYVAMVLKCAGYKVGRYETNDVLEYRDHFQIGGRSISMKGFCELVERVKEVCEQMAAEGNQYPDAAEVSAAIAFLYFRQQGCDLVILSEGAGSPGNIGKVIGDLDAVQKASVGEESADFPKKVKHGLEKQRFDYKEFKGLEITLAGARQVQNAVLAIEVLESLGRQGYEISEKALRKGLFETKCPECFSIIGKKPSFVVHGVYDVDAAAELVQSIELYFAQKRILFIMGMAREAESEKIINMTHKYADWIITVTSPGDSRALSSYELAAEVAEVHPNVTAVDSAEEAAEISHLLAGKEDVIIAFGPVALIGRLMEIAKNRKLG